MHRRITDVQCWIECCWWCLCTTRWGQWHVCILLMTPRLCRYSVLSRKRVWYSCSLFARTKVQSTTTKYDYIYATYLNDNRRIPQVWMDSHIKRTEMNDLTDNINTIATYGSCEQSNFTSLSLNTQFQSFSKFTRKWSLLNILFGSSSLCGFLRGEVPIK